MGGVLIALVLWGFLALLVLTAIYHVVKLGVRDALREHDVERERGRDAGGHRENLTPRLPSNRECRPMGIPNYHPAGFEKAPS
jgi:hypothetical protein